MARYLMTVVEPSTGPGLAPGQLDQIMKDVDALHQEMQDDGVWVFGGGLHPPATATTLRPRGEEVLLTDGPFIEGREQVGGFALINCRDLDEAIEIAAGHPATAIGQVEIRPVRGE